MMGDIRITPQRMEYLLALAKWAPDDGGFFEIPDIDALARQLGIEPKSVHKRFGDLVRLGYVARVPGLAGRTPRYRIVVDPCDPRIRVTGQIPVPRRNRKPLVRYAGWEKGAASW